MSLRAMPCWQVRCDWPGCQASPADWSEFSGWGDKSVAIDEAMEGDWFANIDGTLHYCDGHPVAWASDSEQVASMVGNYLLIHDGDTGDLSHDGTVTFVEAVQ